MIQLTMSGVLDSACSSWRTAPADAASPRGRRDHAQVRRAGLRDWLLTCTHCRAVDLARSQRRPADHVEPLAILGHLPEQTRKALEGLPPASREALVLAYWGGYTCREVSKLTHLPPGVVQSRLRVALTQLEGAVANDWAVT
jgi:DNA-directed RNA polymerase specialized sigma24 family protein